MRPDPCLFVVHSPQEEQPPAYKRTHTHTHTPTALGPRNVECALCVQLFISISPVLRGTKRAFKLWRPESVVAGGKATRGCPDWGWGGCAQTWGVPYSIQVLPISPHPRRPGPETWYGVWWGLWCKRQLEVAARARREEWEVALAVGAPAGHWVSPKGRSSETPSIHKQRSHFTHHKRERTHGRTRLPGRG